MSTSPPAPSEPREPATTPDRVDAGDATPRAAGAPEPRSAPFAQLLGSRPLAIVVLATAALQLVLVATGLPGWGCPLREQVGIPCPGCGMTRAVSALAQGEVGDSLRLHALAPVAVIALLAVALAALAPPSPRGRFVTAVAAFERTTRFSLVIAVAFVVYWALRLTVPLPIA